MSEFRLTITTAALIDIEEAMEWCFNQQVGLDTRFFNILKSTYQQILKILNCMDTTEILSL